MKYLIILLSILTFSCAGDGGEGSIHVIVWKKDGYQLWNGQLEITYGTKKTSPNRSHDTFDIIDGSAHLEGLKIGNYTVSYKGKDMEACATQFRLSFESEMVIGLREGEFIVQQN